MMEEMDPTYNPQFPELEQENAALRARVQILEDENKLIDTLTAELERLKSSRLSMYVMNLERTQVALQDDLARVTGERDAAQDYIQNGTLKKMEEEGIELHKYEHKNYDKLFPNRDGLFWRTRAVLAETAYTAAQERIKELDNLTTMQDGGIRGLHEQIAQLTEREARLVEALDGEINTCGRLAQEARRKMDMECAREYEACCFILRKVKAHVPNL